MNKPKELCAAIAKNDDEYRFLSGLCDKMAACENKNMLTATKFLDAHQLALCQSLLVQAGCRSYVLDGGNEHAERKICLFLPDYPVEHDELRFIRACKSKQDTLTHRDYLGSLMGLQISRDAIGDIFVHETGADIVVLAAIADYLMLEYQKAGRKQLTLAYISRDELHAGSHDTKLIQGTVSSMRLDAVAALAFRLSRTACGELINKGRVLVNAAECLKGDKRLCLGDKITIRGKGKAEIAGISASKKGRIILEVRKYI